MNDTFADHCSVSMKIQFEFEIGEILISESFVEIPFAKSPSFLIRNIDEDHSKGKESSG